MEITLEMAKDLDLILNHILIDPDVYHTSGMIQTQFFPEKDEYYVELLFEVLVEQRQAVAFNNAPGYIKSSGLTKLFLKEGESKVQKIKACQIEQNKRSSKEYEKPHLEIEKLRIDYLDYPATKARVRRSE